MYTLNSKNYILPLVTLNHILMALDTKRRQTRKGSPPAANNQEQLNIKLTYTYNLQTETFSGGK